MDSESLQKALDRLNPEQYESATSTGMILTLAGPGAGKTGMQCTHIALRIHEGIDPQRIASITFTNKAAAESKSRIVSLVGETGWQVKSHTYHSFFRRFVLKPNDSHKLFKIRGYDNGFITLDESDSKAIRRDVFNELPVGVALLADALGVNDKTFNNDIAVYRANGITLPDLIEDIRKQPAEIADFTDFIKAYSKQAVSEYDSDAFEAMKGEANEFLSRNNNVLRPLLAYIWMKYSKQCSSVGGLDFDDQLLYAMELLRDKEIATKVASKFSLFTLDEAQDSSRVQWNAMTSILDASQQKNVLIVADDKQSIYKFRFADIGILNNLTKQYPETKVVTLKQNYRSTHEIVSVSNDFVAVMPEKLGEGTMEAGSGAHGPKPQLHMFDSCTQEAQWVTEHISELVSNGCSPCDIAVLYRGRSQNMAIKNALATADIDYTIVGDVDFWSSKEVTVMLSFLRVITRQQDMYAMARLLDNVPGITGARLKSHMHENEIRNPIDAVKDLCENGKRISANFKAIHKLLTSSLKLNGLMNLTSFIEHTLPERSVREKVLSSPALKEKMKEHYMPYFDGYLGKIHETMMLMWNDYIRPPLLKDALKKGADKAEEIIAGRDANVDTLFNRMKKIMEDDIHSFDMETIVDEMVLRSESNDEVDQNDMVTLLTNHASKGLEFKHVIVLACEAESYFREPCPSSEDEAEEARNLYVAMTRAEQTLTVTSARQRFVNGQLTSRQLMPYLAMIAEKFDNFDHGYQAQIEQDRQQQSTVQNSDAFTQTNSQSSSHYQSAEADQFAANLRSVF